jgi:photosystem II stability/assembly factor-like uncharacterized protein
MKAIRFSILLSFLLIAVFATTGCKKYTPPDSPDSTNKSFELPFENNTLKMELFSSSIPDHVEDMHFFNDSIGLFITYGGNIFKTFDNGDSWSLKYSNPSNKLPLLQILFIDQNVGYVVGGTEYNSPDRTSGGIILKTADGGDTWANVFQISGSIQCNSIAANINGCLFVIGRSDPHKSDKIFKSSDGGINWITLDYNDFQLSKMIFSDNFGFCTGGAYPGNGKIYRSNDNGDTWSETTNFINTDWTWDIAFKDSIGFCIGNNQSIYKTTDYGETWTLIHSGTSYKIDLLTSNSCLIWGGGGWSGGDFGYETGAIRQTANGGIDWIDHNFKKDIGALRCSSFYSATEGYIVAGKYLIKITVK